MTNSRPKKKASPAQRFLAALLERQVVDLIHCGAEREKRRQHENADEYRVDAEIDVDEIGEVGAEDDEGRMRDVDDVEHAERNRNAGGDGGIEGPEQQSGGNCVDQQPEIEIHRTQPEHPRQFAVISKRALALSRRRERHDE